MKIGDYVRTEFGITKIEELDSKGGFYNSNGHFIKDEIIKSSPKIADLIEVGDIIKYHPIQKDMIKSNVLCKMIPSEGELIVCKFELSHCLAKRTKKLISILTHEQYEREAYKVVE